MNKDRRLEERLDRLAGPVDRQGVWASIERRAEEAAVTEEESGQRESKSASGGASRSFPHWTRPRRVRLAAYAAVALVAIAGVTVGTTMGVGLDGGQVVFGTDDGRDGYWEKLPIVEQGGEVWNLMMDPEDSDTLYGATREGVIRSTDGAANWESVLEMGRGFYHLQTIPGSSTSLLAIAHPWGFIMPDDYPNRRMMWSDDGGTTWTEITENLDSAIREEYPGSEPGSIGFVVYDEAEFPGTIILSVQPPRQGPTPFWKSTDQGMTWTKLDEAESHRLYDSQGPPSAEEMYWFEWRALKDASGKVLGSSRAVVIDPDDTSLMYAGTDRGVCKSTDGGETWVDASKGIGHEVGGSLVIDTTLPSTMYVEAQEGIFKSEDEGATWKKILDSGYLDDIGNSICSFALSPSRPSNLYAWTSDGLLRSDDGGATWSERGGEDLPDESYPGGAGSLLAVAGDDPDTVFAKVWTGTQSDLVRSVDGGDSWDTVLERVGHGGLLVDPNGPSTLYMGRLGKQIEGVGGESSLARSTDGGTTWQTVLELDEVVAHFGAALGTGDPTSVYAFHALTPFLLMLDDEGDSDADEIDLDELEVTILRSLDKGASWEEVEFVGLPGPMEQMVCDRRASGVCYGFSYTFSTEDGFADRKVYRSGDGGHTWVTAFESMPRGCNGITIGPGQNGSLYAYGSGGVYKWVPVEDDGADGDSSEDESSSSSEPTKDSSTSSGGWGCSGP